jgi:hypothetical protein
VKPRRQILGISPAPATPRLSRRSFLKGSAATAAALVMAPIAVPVFIPSTRLDYVPRQIVRDATPFTALPAPFSVQALPDTIPMLMLKDTYYYRYGKLVAGNTALIRRSDAGRWLDYGIAVPAPGSGVELAPDTTRRTLEAAQLAGLVPLSGLTSATRERPVSTPEGPALYYPQRAASRQPDHYTQASILV